MHQSTEQAFKLLELLAGIVPVALLAALGGIVRSMQVGYKGLKVVSIAALTSSFTGVIVDLLLQETGLPMSTRAAIVGVSGYASGEILKILVCRILKVLTSHLQDPKEMAAANKASNEVGNEAGDTSCGHCDTTHKK